MNNDWKAALEQIKAAEKIVIIQADNPDADSVGSAMALEGLLHELGKREVTLSCGMPVPRYLRYIDGWDRIVDTLPASFDLWIMVDNSHMPLVDNLTNDPANKAALKKTPAIVFDHHGTVGEETHVKNFAAHIIYLNEPTCVATAELLFNWATANSIPISPETGAQMATAILSDSLGLMTPQTTSNSVRTIARLMDLGVNLSALDERRKEAGKKSPTIVAYKGRLLQRIQYALDNQLSYIHIPWEEIEQYSDEYNPSALVIDEMRLTKGVRVAVSIKSYKDGILTGKIRTNPNAPVGDQIATHFGGGGHRHASGFKTSDHPSIEELEKELIRVVGDCLKEYDETKDDNDGRDAR